MPQAQNNTGRVALLGSRVERGHCVIINDCDRPCAKLIAVVDRVEGDTVFALYLAIATSQNKCSSWIERVTPIDLFGVQAFTDGKLLTVTENTTDKDATRAIYPDGTPRRWQPHASDSETWPVRGEPIKLAIEHARQATT